MYLRILCMSVFVIFKIFVENHNIVPCCYILNLFVWIFNRFHNAASKVFSRRQWIYRRYFTKIINGRYHFQIEFTESREAEQNDKNKGRDGEGAGSGKIKKSKEIRKGLPTLTFSGGWVNNARGTQPRRAGDGFTKCHHKEARMCLFGNLPFSTVSPAQPGCHEIFILFFDDDLAWGFIYFLGSGSTRRACERQKKTEGGERRVETEK